MKLNEKVVSLNSLSSPLVTASQDLSSLVERKNKINNDANFVQYLVTVN